jgi:hypothetical protein
MNIPADGSSAEKLNRLIQRPFNIIIIVCNFADFVSGNC